MSDRFAFYAEPVLVATDGGTISLHVGLGSQGTEESVLLHLGDGYRHDADILLGVAGVTNLIRVLSECLEGMTDDTP